MHMLKSKRITVNSLLFATKSALYAHGGEEMIPAVQAIEEAALSASRRSKQRGGVKMTQLSDWVDQYRAELEKEVSNRAALIEGLLLAGDYQACRDWLDQWQEEDNSEESPAYKYNQAKILLRLSRSFRGKTSADEMKAPSAGFVQNAYND